VPGERRAYRSVARLSYTRRGGLEGAPYEGFAGTKVQTTRIRAADSPRLRLHAYVPAGEEHLKVPDWLTIRSISQTAGQHLQGESSTKGILSSSMT